MLLLGVLLGAYVAGLATLPGLAFLIAIFSVQRRVGARVAALRSQIVAQTDKRVKLMHDVLAGSEALKVNAWEDALARRVSALRAAEERLLWRSLVLQSTMEALIFFAPGVATFLVLVTRYAIDQAAGEAAERRGLEIEQAYAVLGLCNVLVKQFNIFPRSAKSFDEALVSFRRVERFLLLPEARPQAPGQPPALEPLPQRGSSVATPAFVMLDEASSGDVVEHAVTLTEVPCSRPLLPSPPCPPAPLFPPLCRPELRASPLFTTRSGACTVQRPSERAPYHYCCSPLLPGDGLVGGGAARRACRHGRRGREGRPFPAEARQPSRARQHAVRCGGGGRQR